MAKWDAALYTEKLLKRSSLDQMWTPVKLNSGKIFPYGFGWTIDVNGHRLIDHNGAWQGFKSNISRYVDDRLTLVVLANSDYAAVHKIAQGVAALYVPALKKPETQNPK